MTSRTAETETSYEERVHALRLIAEREDRAGGDVFDLIGWFCAQDRRWKPSTVRQYRAANWHLMEMTPLDPEFCALLEARLRKGPAPRTDGTRRTSARKRKSVPREQFLRLEAILGESRKHDDPLIRGFLVFGAALFLRPVEYFDARVEGTTLIVRNAKATNGRANGDERERDIAELGDKAIAALVNFLDHLQKALAAGGWKALLGRLASRLARVCKSLGIARVSLYTMRHVGMATAKSWLEPVEVAAAAGHASVHTATSHYAKRRTGWVGLRMAGKPTATSIARVRGTARIFRPGLLVARCANETEVTIPDTVVQHDLSPRM